MNVYDPKGSPMHASRADTPNVEPDLHLVTLPDAAKYLAVSRGALYVLHWLCW